MDYKFLGLRLDKEGRYWYNCKYVCLNMELTHERDRESNRRLMSEITHEMVLGIGEDAYGEANPWTQEWLRGYFRKAPYMHPDEEDYVEYKR